jgi:hypothetical protein
MGEDELDALSQRYDDEIASLGDRYDEMEASQSQNKTGWAGVAQDLRESLSSLPSTFVDMLPALGSELSGIGSQLVNDPKRLGLNFAAGIPQFGANLLSTPGNIRDYLGEKEIVSPEAPSFRLPESILPRNYDYAEAIGVEGQQPGDALAQGLTSTLPYGLAGELGALRALPRMGARAGAQGAAAVGANQDPVSAAALSLGLEGGLRGAGKAVGKLAPSNLFRGSLTPEELMRNLEVSAGTNTPLGSVLDSPTLKAAFENISSRTLGGGGDAALGTIENQVTQAAENVINKTGKGLPQGDPNEVVKASLKKGFEEQTKKKNALYKPVSDIAKKEGFELDLKEFGRKAADKGRILEESPLMQSDAKLRSAFSKLSGFSNPTIKVESAILGPNGKPLISREIVPSIAEANLVKNRFNEIAKQYANSPKVEDRHLASQFKDMARTLNSDVEKSIQTSGSDKLKTTYSTAKDNYKKNFAQFLDKDIYKFLSPEKNAESIVHEIIKPGKTKDQYKRIEKINNILPESEKNLLGNTYLKGAIDKEGNINPKKLAELINKLGDRQFKALFPDAQTRRELLNYGKLRGMNEKALSKMANPPTGYQNFLPAQIAASAASGGALLTAGHPLLAIGSVFGPSLLAKGFNKYATSEGRRNAIVKKILEKENLKGPQASTKKAGARQAALGASLGLKEDRV